MSDDRRRRGAVRLAAAAVGIIVLAAVVAVTLSPIALRPTISGSADIERIAAFALLASSFVTAFPDRWRLVLVATLSLAGLLEIAQNLRLDRHAQIHDFAAKTLGCFAGTVAALALRRLAADLVA